MGVLCPPEYRTWHQAGPGRPDRHLALLICPTTGLHPTTNREWGSLPPPWAFSPRQEQETPVSNNRSAAWPSGGRSSGSGVTHLRRIVSIPPRTQFMGDAGLRAPGNRGQQPQGGRSRVAKAPAAPLAPSSLTPGSWTAPAAHRQTWGAQGTSSGASCILQSSSCVVGQAQPQARHCLHPYVTFAGFLS